MPPRNKYTTMTNNQRTALCRHAAQNKQLTQQDLRNWLKETYDVTVSQPVISSTLKASVAWLGEEETRPENHKRQKIVKYPLLEEALIKWFTGNQEIINMSGDLLKEKEDSILEELLNTTAQEPEGEEEQENDSIEPVKISAKEAERMVDNLELFWMQDGNLAEAQKMRCMKKAIVAASVKSLGQTILDQYFRKA
ncbi:DNA-binding centromere protein B (CENP-B) [Thalictrum thalictroides]|uniref:DNA-binding centromere protein B (CENP-B) n=1 Tax=Thalictrum thalictroides TaxID=46969 RepID=A0A7J6V5J5_THATH|nr:DNA-binding centromere protein B (CENP-B) [Thalictrum thalictroides]